MPKILPSKDNEMNRDMLSRRLERKGYTIVIAVDGQQAKEAGCDDYDVKPVELPRLLGKMEVHLG